MTTMPEIKLEHGDWRARVLPQGGLLGALDFGGAPVLRSMASGTHSALEAACFPMVPWCNRIADARFTWEGVVVALARNFLPEPHAIHGHGWQSDWAVAHHLADSCELVHRHDGAGPGWPWAYEARQTIALSDAGCTIALSLTNLSGRLMPAGLGFHPYLRRRRGSRLRFVAGQVVDVGADMIPTGEHLPADRFGQFAKGAGLPDELIDHCFTDWDGVAEVTDDLGTITLTAQGATGLHLYTPYDPTILCLEPVNHCPDGANTGAMTLCAPGETMRLSLRIAACAA